MQITIELSQEEYEPIQKMADYCGTNAARIVESLVEGAAAQYLDEQCSRIWWSITDYLRRTEGFSENIARIETFLLAYKELDKCKTIAERKKASFGQFSSLAAFEAWQKGEFNRN